MDPDELTLTSIDQMRHLVTSEVIVQAAGFAARAGHSDRTVYRFIVALAMTSTLNQGVYWPRVLKRVMALEAEKETP